MAEALEIKDVLWKMPEALSGGMKHRVALGRTFLADSNLMILDEAFRGLDKELKGRIVDRLWEKETADKTVMVISHNKEDIELLGIDESIYVE
jgi:NitT/TauT family transport system ATP-binding protein